MKHLWKILSYQDVFAVKKHIPFHNTDDTKHKNNKAKKQLQKTVTSVVGNLDTHHVFPQPISPKLNTKTGTKAPLQAWLITNYEIRVFKQTTG